MFSSLRGPGRLRWVALGGLIVLGAALIGGWLVTRRPGNLVDQGVEFTTEQPAAQAPPSRRPEGAHPADDGAVWPVYGLTDQRTRAMAVARPLRPPFVRRWTVGGGILLEFTPVLCRRSLFLLKNNGALYSISRLTGRVRWKRKLGYLAASSPACGGRTVYATLLQRGKNVRAGRVVAVDMDTGRTRWSRRLPSRSESSPLLDRGRLYLGSEDGTVYALRARDGAIRWTYRADGSVKGGLALDDGRLFFGDYGGRLHAIRQSDGRRLWRSGGAGRAFGLGRGRFYATPAVAYGRVYIGSTDGFVYSMAANDGRLAWRRRTGGYVYSSPAVTTVAGLGPTVFVGSYDGRLYALDARSGRPRWIRNAGGKISGGPTVIGDLVFYANLTARSTGAVGAATGRLVWAQGSGAFNPVISDGRRLYVVGYSSISMLSEPRQARLDQRFLERGLSAAQLAARRRARSQARRAAVRRRAEARRAAARRRVVARRVAARRRALRANAAARRAGREVCFRSGGRRICRLPRPLVCYEAGPDGRVVCRPRQPSAR